MFSELKAPETSQTIINMVGQADALNVPSDDSQGIILQFKLTSFSEKVKLIHKDRENDNAKSYYTSVLSSLERK